MKTSTRTTSRRAVAEIKSHRRYDIAGILLIALAVVTGVALAVGNAGVVGDVSTNVLTQLFGRGAWACVAFLFILGIGLLSGRRSLEVTGFGVGATLIFLAVTGALATPVAGDYFDTRAIPTGGGYVGASVGWAMHSLLGQAHLVGIGALALIGLVLCLHMPVHGIIELIAAKHKAQQAERAKLKPKEVAAKSLPKGEAVVSGRARILERTPMPEPQPELPVEAEAKTKKSPVIREVNNDGPDLSKAMDSTPKEGYKLPPLSLLQPMVDKPKRSPQEMQHNIQVLESTLEEFGIDANVVEIATGPTITRYEIQLGPGIRVNRITALADNIAMNMAASHVRVEAPIPGKAAIGVEVPNAKPSPVNIREVCETKEFRDNPSRLVVCLGQDVSGLNKYADLTKMPHLLIGGATNSGKSIGLASIIMSLLMRNTPKDLRLVMIDPKRVELTLFDSIPHLMCPVIKDVKESPGVLRAVWREMDRRYDVFSEAKVRNIDGWNERASFQDKMPYIVVIIDELADLMIQAANEVETSICRLAQLARATGIHLVIATQRPSVDVITGTIKANIASRISFTVSSQIDSRTILDQAGAERLIGRGDMLFLPIDANKPIRVQGCYVSEKEIEAVCNFWREQEGPAYVLNPMDYADSGDAKVGKGSGGGADENDPLWEEIVTFSAERGQVSTSMLQRKFSIGFQRASRLIDMMEERGVVGPRDGPRPRDVLLNIMEVEAMFGRGNPMPNSDFSGDDLE